jgi:hypothetical protein
MVESGDGSTLGMGWFFANGAVTRPAVSGF